MSHYKIALKDEVKIVSATEDVMGVADQMVARLGGVPQISRCDAQGNPLVSTPVVPAEPVKTQQQQFSSWDNTVVDEAAKKRIEEQQAAINAAGIKVDAGQQFFATGTRMAEVGYETQAKRKQEYLNRMPLKDAVQELKAVIFEEDRCDEEVIAKKLADSLTVQRKLVYYKDYLLTEQAIRGILTRLKSPAITYITGLQSRIVDEGGKPTHQRSDHWLGRDMEQLADILKYELMRAGHIQFKLRKREGEFPDVFAALSPTFSPADAPSVLDQIEGIPPEARGSWSYDRNSTAWSLRAEVFTPTPVEEQAVGEAFSGYVNLGSRDNGTGRFRGGGGIELLRCLNASTYSAGETMSRVHRGRINYDIKSMINKATNAIRILCKAWGVARETEVPVPEGLTLEQAIPGIWSGLLRQGDFATVLAGRKENNIKALTRSFYDQRRDPEKLVKSDFAQAWTHHIQSRDYLTRQEGEVAAASFIVNPQKFHCDLDD